MQPRIAIADGSRLVARALTIILIPTILLYLLFVVLQLRSGEAGFLGLSLRLAFLVVIVAGFAIAWRREALGAVLSLGSLVASFVYAVLASDFGEAFSFSPLVWPLSLIVALIRPQSFDPIPSWIIAMSWVLLVLPIALFFASWGLRRSPVTAPSPG